MGLYGNTRQAPNNKAGQYEFFRRHLVTGQEDPVEVEEVPLDDSDDQVAGLRAELAASQAEAARLRTQVGILETRLGTNRTQVSSYPAATATGAMSDTRMREILASHPSGAAALRQLDADRAASQPRTGGPDARTRELLKNYSGGARALALLENS